MLFVEDVVTHFDLSLQVLFLDLRVVGFHHEQGRIDTRLILRNGSNVGVDLKPIVVGNQSTDGCLMLNRRDLEVIVKGKDFLAAFHLPPDPLRMN